MELIVVSIGALSKNPLWQERVPVRTSHATTTLIRAGKANILVDPSLPAQILEARLFERTGLKPEAVTGVFLTNWRPVHRRALGLFANVPWWMSEAELQAADAALDQLAEQAERGGAAVDELVASERALLKKLQTAPDELGENVDLFPLPGYTAGQCGLLISQSMSSTVIAGDAVPTAAHFAAGQVFAESYDLEQAKASMAEMYEIADYVIPGHDNIFANPRAAGI